MRSELMVVIGATSEIAAATVRLWAAAQRWRFCLLGRNAEAVVSLAHEISSLSGQEVFYGAYDALWSAAQQDTLWRALTLSVVSEQAPTAAMQESLSLCVVSPTGERQSLSQLPVSVEVAAVFCAVGYLGPQQQAQTDDALCARIFTCNYSGLLPLLNRAANYFEQRGQGQLVVISSVAGERGRGSNYFYGAAKAAMTAYLSGLRIRLTKSTQGRVQVLSVLPGYVRTKMVAGRQLPALLTPTPERVAADIVRACEHRRNVLYTIWPWYVIMAVTRHIPECIFKHLHRF